MKHAISPVRKRTHTHTRTHAHLRRLARTGPVASTLLGALPAHAVVRLTDVQVLDRDRGETLQIHRHRDEHWLAGRRNP